jgi:hypothetical protein
LLEPVVLWPGRGKAALFPVPKSSPLPDPEFGKTVPFPVPKSWAPDLEPIDWKAAEKHEDLEWKIED